MTQQSFLFPVRVSLHKRVLKTRGAKSLVSTAFHAEFGAASSAKSLRRTDWVQTNVLKPSEIENEIVLGSDFCPLYRQDWSDVPTLADWNKGECPRYVGK